MGGPVVLEEFFSFFSRQRLSARKLKAPGKKKVVRARKAWWIPRQTKGQEDYVVVCLSDIWVRGFGGGVCMLNQWCYVAISRLTGSWLHCHCFLPHCCFTLTFIPDPRTLIWELSRWKTWKVTTYILKFIFPSNKFKNHQLTSQQAMVSFSFLFGLVSSKWAFWSYFCSFRRARSSN